VSKPLSGSFEKLVFCGDSEKRLLPLRLDWKVVNYKENNLNRNTHQQTTNVERLNVSQKKIIEKTLIFS